MRKYVGLLAGLISFLCAGPALADCLEGLRNVTPGETQYFKQVTAALKAALPAPPPNWKLNAPRDRDLGGFCTGTAEGDFEIRISADYVYTPPKEEGNRLYADYRKLQSEIDALKQLPPAVAKDRQQWLDKMSEANRASNAAYKAGDKALAKQKDSDAEEASKKARDIRDQYLASVKQQVQDLEAKQKTIQYRGTTVRVTVVANEEKTARPAGAAPIVIGPAATPKAPGLKVQNVKVYLDGGGDKRGVIQAAIDQAALQKIVQLRRRGLRAGRCRGGLDARARERGELPVGAGLGDAQDVDGAVVAHELAIAVVAAEPLVDDFHYRDAAAVQVERARQVTSGVAAGFDGEAHGVVPRLCRVALREAKAAGRIFN